MVRFLKYREYVMRVLSAVFLFLPACLYAAFLRKKKEYQHIWLISERGDEARDNAYHLYRYICERHPEVNAWFVLTKDSPDMRKMEGYSRIVEPRTLRHFVLFVLAERLISTHEHGAAPYGRGSQYLMRLLPRKRHVYLKHGIIKDKFRLRDEVNDVIVCASDWEARLYQDNTPKNLEALRIIGLCRYDSLHDRSKEQEKKIILLMPTFRFWLEDIGRLAGRDELFRQDPYFICWNALLSDRRFQDFTREAGYEVVFYPHYRSQKYLHNFKGYPENFTIADNTSYDIQDLLTRSSMMVTDFSSVFFDFSYMEKPVVHFQFDEVKYRNLQYKEGEFSYRHHGFGPVYDEKEAVVSYIIERAAAGFTVEEMYLERIATFFKYRDQNNTRRNFETILELP